MKKENVVEIVKQRIKENERLFTRGELQIINNNANLIKKVYILGLLDVNKLQ